MFAFRRRERREEAGVSVFPTDHPVQLFPLEQPPRPPAPGPRPDGPTDELTDADVAFARRVLTLSPPPPPRPPPCSPCTGAPGRQ